MGSKKCKLSFDTVSSLLRVKHLLPKSHLYSLAFWFTQDVKGFRGAGRGGAGRFTPAHQLGRRRGILPEPMRGGQPRRRLRGAVEPSASLCPRSHPQGGKEVRPHITRALGTNSEAEGTASQRAAPKWPQKQIFGEAAGYADECTSLGSSIYRKVPPHSSTIKSECGYQMCKLLVHPHIYKVSE